MTRLTHLLTALGLTCGFVAAIIAACGGQPIAPREMPPIAPRPERLDPTAFPVPATDPGNSPIDAARPARPTPISPVGPVGSSAPMHLASASQPIEGAAQDAGTGKGDAGGGGGVDAQAPGRSAPDAGVVDSQAPQLPPIPDGNLPADSRLEPIRLRDGRGVE